MEKWKYWMTYRKKIALAFSALIIIPMLLFFYFLFQYNISRNEKQFSDQSERISAAYMESIADLFSVCIQKLQCVDDEPKLQEYLTSNNDELSRLIEMRYYLDALYNSLLLNQNGMQVSVYRFNDNRFPIGFVKEIDMLDNSIVNDCLKQEFGEALVKYMEEKNAICFYKLNRALDGTVLSITEVVLSMERLQSIFPVEKSQDFIAVLTTPDGLSTPLNQDVLPLEYPLYETGKACQNTLVIENCLQKSDRIFRYVSNIYLPFQSPEIPPEQPLYGSISFFFSSAPIYQNMWTMGLSLLLFSVLIFFMISRMSHMMTKKLDSIVEEIQKIYLPSSHYFVSQKKVDEFAIISDKIRQMVDEMNRQSEKEKIISLEKKELETQLLQELINPHFLYNTLDSIKWISANPKVSVTVDSIVDYYRMLLSKGNLFIPIETELRIVREYVKIQRFAYESDFRYIEDIQGDIPNCLVMKHILQPFIENSLLHGIDKSGDNGEIVLRVWSNGKKIYFEITDNGCGAEQSQVDKILEGAGLEGRGGYGMLNVKKRLHNIYGDDAFLRIQTKPGKGTKVMIGLPIQEAGQNKQ